MPDPGLQNLIKRAARLAAVSLVQLAVPAMTWAGDCFDTAGQRYAIDPALIRAVASVESGMRANAVNRDHAARTGTIDIGLMQINSGWLPKLSRLGVSQLDLFDPCTNIQVGTGILADVLARHGDTWDAVGAYNAACTQLKGDACRQARSRYAWRVHRHLVKTRATTAPAVALTPVPMSAGLISFADAAAEAAP